MGPSHQAGIFLEKYFNGLLTCHDPIVNIVPRCPNERMRVGVYREIICDIVVSIAITIEQI